MLIATPFEGSVTFPVQDVVLLILVVFTVLCRHMTHRRNLKSLRNNEGQIPIILFCLVLKFYICLGLLYYMSYTVQ